MKLIKRVLIVLGIFLVFLIGAMAAIPYFFKDELTQKATTAINQAVDAEVGFADVGITFFRHFPDLTLSLQELEIINKAPFAGLPLAQVQSLAITVDVIDLIRNRGIRVEKIDVIQPRIRIKVLEDGSANYNIAKSSASPDTLETEQNPGDYSLALKGYSLQDASLEYDDAATGTFLSARGLEHQGSGNFTAQIFDLDTETTAGEIDLNYQGIDYLSRAQADLKAILNIDQSTNTYTLKDNNLKVNELTLLAEGFVQLLESAYRMDLDISSPQNRFKDLLSMVPGAYLEGYEDVRADGNFVLQGKVAGIYDGAQNIFPNFNFLLDVADGNIQYPDLPLGVEGINTQARIDQPGDRLDDLIVDVAKFDLKIGSNPISGRFRLARPISNPTVDTKVKGTLNLKELAQAFPLPMVKTLEGVIDADVEAKASMQQIDRGDYDNILMRGQATGTGIQVETDVYPIVRLAGVQTDFSPQVVRLRTDQAQLGQSDIQAQVDIQNILAYFSPEKTMEGNIRLRSQYLLADEWIPKDQGAPTPDTSSTNPLGESEIFDRFQFAVDAVVGEIDYGSYKIKDSQLQGVLSPNRLQIDRVSTQIDASDILASGEVNNLYDFMFGEESLQGEIELRSNYLNLNPFMTTSSGATPAAGSADTTTAGGYGTLLVPADIAMQVRATVGELIYTNMNIKDLQGALVVEDRGVELRDVVGNTLGGRVSFNGLYETPENEDPLYRIKLQMDRLNFQESFRTLNTFQQLAPIAAFVEGIFNTSLSLEGTLGEDMMPNLSTLNAAGFLETLDGKLKSFPPLQKLGEKLRINELKQAVSLENTKNWLEITNGAVEVKPFDFVVEDIPMTIAGKHGLNREMDYNITAAIPVEKLEENPVGADISGGLDQIYAEVNKLGLDLKRAETVNVLINLTGSIRNPLFKINVLGLDGQVSVKDAVAEKAKDIIDKQKTELEDTLSKKLESEKERLAKEARKVVDSAKLKLGQKADSLIQGKLDSTVGNEAKKVLDSLLKKTEVDKVKDQLEKFNPFKKKKKKNDGGSG